MRPPAPGLPQRSIAIDGGHAAASIAIESSIANHWA